ncbi:MAG: RNA-binding cell elongation regulator Jag/EloR [Armatimonadota bacterium]|nr:RNA-binding cell elongation regulator Jag/EloR [Armatimonadota bacterium]
MDTSIEQTGQTVEEAVEAALLQLGASRDEVEVEVLDDGSGNLLVPAAPSEARVRVTLLPSAKRARAAQAAEAQDEEGEEASASRAWAERVRHVTQHIVDLMGLQLQAIVSHADRHQVTIELTGPDTRIIIGKHGQTLEALQHLVSLIASKEAGRRRRVLVDAEGYQQRRRERRAQELVAMARADARRARELGQEALITYAVGPYERRIIHLAFKDDPDFITYSEGEEPNRYVVISPRD